MSRNELEASTPFSQASFDYRPGKDFEDENQRRYFPEQSSSFLFQNYKNKHKARLKPRANVDSEFSDNSGDEYNANHYQKKYKITPQTGLNGVSFEGGIYNDTVVASDLYTAQTPNNFIVTEQASKAVQMRNKANKGK